MAPKHVLGNRGCQPDTGHSPAGSRDWLPGPCPLLGQQPWAHPPRVHSPIVSAWSDRSSEHLYGLTPPSNQPRQADPVN